MYYFYFKVCYFHAETEAKVDEDYKSLAKQLEVEEEKEEDRIRKVNGKLTKLAKTNEIVFIFDNVSNGKIYHALIAAMETHKKLLGRYLGMLSSAT